MTNDPFIQKLREISWRRELTNAEAAELRSWLVTHPEARADWEAEASLSHALAQLPDAPVPSNFTSRVLKAVESETASETRSRNSIPWWRNLGRQWRWLPGTAFATLVLFAGLVVQVQNVRARDRQELLKSVALVSGVSTLPNTEVLTNFEAIRVLNHAPQADEQLLALLQ